MPRAELPGPNWGKVLALRVIDYLSLSHAVTVPGSRLTNMPTSSLLGMFPFRAQQRPPQAAGQRAHLLEHRQVLCDTVTIHLDICCKDSNYSMKNVVPSTCYVQWYNDLCNKTSQKSQNDCYVVTFVVINCQYKHKWHGWSEQGIHCYPTLLF